MLNQDPELAGRCPAGYWLWTLTRPGLSSSEEFSQFIKLEVPV